MGHWYNKDGQPEYTQTAKAGHQRDTTLADAKKKGLFKSVTTVLAIPSKPQLDFWKQGQLLDAALQYQYKIPDPNDFEGITSWKELVIKASGKIGRDSADIGSKIHDALEKYYSLEEDPNYENLKQYRDPAIQELKDIVDIHTCIAEASFSSIKHKFGGKVDLHSKEGKGFILDFKTKNKDVVDKKTPYFENCMQLAAYRLGLGLPKARCYNLYISTTKPGQVYLHMWSEKEVKKAEKMFLLLNKYFDLANNL